MFKTQYKIGVIAYVLLLILAIIFYIERTVFLDISLHIFSLIVNKGFAIQNYRFNAVLTQIPPLAAIKLQLPLKAIMLIYSTGFILLYFTCYIVCGYVLKQYRYGIALLLFSLLFVTDTFYWMQSELPQGVALMVVLFAYMSDRETNKLSGIGLGLLYIGLMAVAFSHPTTAILYVYVSLFLLLDKNSNINKKLLYSSLLFYITVVVIKKVVFPTAYEANAISGSSKIFDLFPNYLNLESNKVFIKLVVKKYYWIPISLIAIAIIYIKEQKWIKLLLFCSFFFGYLLLVNVSYADGKAATFYIENLYLPLGLILGFPLVFDIFPLLERKRLLTVAVILIIASGIIRIYLTHDLYTTRLNWERNLLNKYEHEKVVIDEKTIPIDTLLMSWGSSYEFWLLSTAEKEKTSSIIIHNNIDELKYGIDLNKGFLTMWGSYPYEQLPSRYFKFSDTTSKYKIIQ
jgi:hypothetical protein